jgi:hypothetical protein
MYGKLSVDAICAPHLLEHKYPEQAHASGQERWNVE